MSREPQKIEQAIEFVRTAKLPPVISALGRRDREAPEAIFNEEKSQAAVVGSDVMSFMAGVAPQVRKDIVNCSLLAQLVANKSVSNRESLGDWYKAYFDTLTNVGWVIQEQGFAEHHETGNVLEANKAILRIATALLGPGTAALALIQTTLDALKSMSEGPWITIFERESQTQKAARFQVTLVEPEAARGFSVALMAYELEATSDLTQVLFFKLRKNDVTLRHASGRVAIDTDVLTAIREPVAQKIASHSASFIAGLPI